MKLPIIVDILQRDESGGIRTQENRWDEEYIINIANVSRGELAHLVFNGSRTLGANTRLNNSWYQKLWFQLDDGFQDEENCVIKFQCPPFISLNKTNDGIRYIGSEAGSNAYKRIKTRSELDQILRHQVMKMVMYKEIGVLYDAPMQTLEVYTDLILASFMVEGLVQNPLMVTTYNIDEDEYPVPDDYIPMLLEIAKLKLYPQSTTPIDTVDNGKEGAVVQQQPQMRKR